MSGMSAPDRTCSSTAATADVGARLAHHLHQTLLERHRQLRRQQGHHALQRRRQRDRVACLHQRRQLVERRAITAADGGDRRQLRRIPACEVAPEREMRLMRGQRRPGWVVEGSHALSHERELPRKRENTKQTDISFFRDFVIRGCHHKGHEVFTYDHDVVQSSCPLSVGPFSISETAPAPAWCSAARRRVRRSSPSRGRCNTPGCWRSRRSPVRRIWRAPARTSDR